MKTHATPLVFSLSSLSVSRRIPAQLLACLLLSMAAAPDTNADYLVRRTSYVPGMPAIEAECGATDPVTQCFPDDSLSTATSLSGFNILRVM